MSKKQKEKRQSIGRILRNNLVLFGKVCRYTPEFVLLSFVIEGIFLGINNAVYGVFTLYLFNSLDRGDQLDYIVTIIGLMALWYLFYFAVERVYHRMLKNLSKGYKQRVGIAQALVGNPPVIIFDEPTIGLDPKQIIEIRNLIRTLGKEHTVIISTHILQEVQAVCDRIVIINKGKVVANELTENISRAVENTRRFNVKISGPQRDVLALLRNLPGICYAEVLAARDGDAYTYMIESEVGIDIRKKLFWALAERKWPMIGLEALGMSIEDIFIAVVDKTAPEVQKPKKKTRYEGVRAAEEKELAADIVKKTAEEQENASYEVEETDSDFYEDHTIKEDTFASKEKTEETSDKE